MSESGIEQYPSNGTLFGEVLDEYRCPAVHGAKRCQLHRGHAGPHAHAHLPPSRACRPVRWAPAVVRFDATAEWPHDGTRLRWCCMFRE